MPARWPTNDARGMMNCVTTRRKNGAGLNGNPAPSAAPPTRRRAKVGTSGMRHVVKHSVAKPGIGQYRVERTVAVTIHANSTHEYPTAREAASAAARAALAARVARETGGRRAPRPKASSTRAAESLPCACSMRNLVMPSAVTMVDGTSVAVSEAYASEPNRASRAIKL